MKIKLVTSFVLGFLAVGFIFFSTNTAENSNPLAPVPGGDKFPVGMMHSAIFPNGNYNDLGVNLTHAYNNTEDTGSYPRDPNKHTPSGWVAPGSDYLYSDVPASLIQTKLNDIYNNYNHSKVIWQRPKIEWLCYGQSSTYQAEAVSRNHDYWFYAFQNNSGVSMADNQFNNGDSVLYISQIESGPGARIVLSRLKANAEQCRRDSGATSNQWHGDSESTWYIKPRMRIDSSIVDNNPNTLVCKIIVIDDTGTDTLKQVDIKAINFRDDDLNYDGRYLEEFYNLPELLTYTGAWGKTSWYRARGDTTSDINRSKADIQVYWYDNCNLWIDYVKVENDVAHNLLSDTIDNVVHDEFLEWIDDEVAAVYGSGPQNVHSFYIELFEFNQIPCMAYVNKRIREKSNHTIGLMADLLCFYPFHMQAEYRSDVMSTEKIKRMWYDRVQPLQVFLGDPYPINASPAPGCENATAQFSQIPSTLNAGGDYVLADSTPPETYDAWLQGMLDTVCGLYFPNGLNQEGPKIPGVFMHLMKYGDSLSKSFNVPFIAMLQAHQWASSGEVDREPTNEEFNLMTNLAVSYGAKGITYWWYPSTGNNKCDHSRGFLETDGSKRVTNVYGQNKWDSAKVTIDRLQNKWGPHLLSFNNADRHSYIYRLERSNLISETYFNDIKTYPPDINGSPGSTPDAADLTYLQAATFKSSNTNEQYNHYFMLVNRRCSPYRPDISENGGRRFVKVKFDASAGDLSAFNNWKIINVSDSSVVAVFDKQTSSYIDLGWYMPGEGRLYKIAPVMQEGGTLIVDESFGGVSFTCMDTVLNDNKNITITGTNSTISFTDSATINMSGGIFQSSTSTATSGPGNKNIFQGFNGHKWGGLRFTGSTVKIYDAKFLDISSPAVNHAVKMLNCTLGDIRNNIFTMNTDTSGAVHSVYTSSEDVSYSLYINYNTITMNNSRTNAVQVQGFSGLTMPLYANSNTMTSNG